jgi:hypothetical protein
VDFGFILYRSFSVFSSFFFYNLFCVVRSSLDDKLLGGLSMMHGGTADRPGEAIPTNAPDAVNYFPNRTPRDIKIINPLTPELNPTAQHCLTRFFTGDFALEPRISLIYA